MKTANVARAVLSLPLFLGSSCAWMMTGTTSTIRITSTPPGAKVSTCIGTETTAPCELVLPNGQDVTITAVHASAPTDVREFRSVPDLSSWSAGNLIMIGGFAGMALDVASPTTKVHKSDLHFDFTHTQEELNALAEEASRARDARRASYGGTLK